VIMKDFIYIITPILLLLFTSGANSVGCFDAAPDFNDCKVKADQGNAKAQYNLGQMYRRGAGVAQDYKEAVRWYRKAVEQRNDKARYWLGVMLARGQGVSEDYKKEIREKRKQAEQRSNKLPQIAVGVYSRGQGDKQGLQPNVITNRTEHRYVTLKADHSGHFRGVALINNKESNFLIDTGASFVSVPEDLAWKAHLRKGKK